MGVAARAAENGERKCGRRGHSRAQAVKWSEALLHDRHFEH